jgi:parvulin-like peptidyl-prolyl isomerase
VKRLTTVLAGLVAISLLSFGLSGCNVRFSPYAAVVNGSEISQGQLRDALAAISANAGYKCAIQSSGSTHIAGVGQGTYNASFSAQVLSILIQDKIVRQAVVKRRLPEPSSLYPIAVSQLQASTTPPSSCPGSGASLVAAFAPSYRSVLIKFQEDEDALAGALAGVTLSPTGLGAYAAAHKSLMSLACVSVIEVAAKATATSLRSQLSKGASFAALAKAHSLDTASAPSGGALGCIPDAEFSAPLGTDLAALSVGQVSAPVAFSTDWLLLLVTKRQPEPYRQQATSLIALEQTNLNQLFPRVIKTAQVQVDPQFGKWDTTASPAKVIANAGPRAAIVPNPGANS